MMMRCRRVFEPDTTLDAAGRSVPPAGVSDASFIAWQEQIKLVGYGVDTLVLNVRYSDAESEPVQRELDDELMQHLELWQGEAKRDEEAVASDWAFHGALLFVEPHGAGRQWRWRLTCRWLSLLISRGTFNGVIAQVRLSSEYLWSRSWCGEAISEMHAFLMSIFGEHIHLQVSSVDLCADLVGYDFALANYEQHFITRARKQAVVYGPDTVNLDSRTPSYLRFSSSASPISCRIYNKTQEIRQKSQKTWFYDLWWQGVPGPAGGSWDGSTEVWRVEFHFKREFLRNLKPPLEGAYELLDRLLPLWRYATGQAEPDAEGVYAGWLRYTLPAEDSNRSRWPVHPAWLVVQAAFVEPLMPGLGPVVRERIREKNLERGLAAMVGYSSTLAAWLGGQYAAAETDLSITLQWLNEQGQGYLMEKERDYGKEIRKKEQRFSTARDE